MSSIRTQLIIVLVALVSLLLIQGMLARQNQQVLNDGLEITRQAINDVSLVKELERDVLDLQRNVLIFKETASLSAVNRFTSNYLRCAVGRTSFIGQSGPLEKVLAHVPFSSSRSAFSRSRSRGFQRNSETKAG